MATKKKIAPRASRTKAETQEALEMLQDRATSVMDTELSAAEQQRQNERNKAARATTAALTVETVAQKLTTVGLDISKVLAGISEQIVAQMELLENVKSAVEQENADLEAIHGKDVVATSLADLLKEYELKQKELEESYDELRVTRDAQHAAASQELNTKIADLRKQYSELLVSQKIEREREEAEFAYKRDLTRRQEQEKYNFDIVQRNNAEKLRVEELNRGWIKREQELYAKEGEYTAALKRIEGLPQELEAQRLVAFNDAKKSFETSKHFEVTALKKEAEANEKLARFEIENLKAANADLKETIAKLSADLAAANEKVKGIAEKALESASSQRTLAEMSVMTQNRQDNGVSRKS